ncbi:MAG: hypothetical protein II306_06015 [Clostridia bacterium]|nr:hypothetical protein [Clostridia bacterium]
MINKEWEEIISIYKKAQGCLWCPKKPHGGYWRRDEGRGYYYLWTAYRLATDSPQKNHLWYARILYMMASEHLHRQGDFDVLKNYLQPCMEEYEKAKNEDKKPTELEITQARVQYDMLNYIFTVAHSNESIEHAYSLVGEFVDIADFSFHDSSVVAFSVNDSSTAILTLDYNGILLTLEFEGVSDVQLCGFEPEHNWIFSAYCYLVYQGIDYVFDCEYVKIQFQKLKSAEIKRKENNT